MLCAQGAWKKGGLHRVKAGPGPFSSVCFTLTILRWWLVAPLGLPKATRRVVGGSTEHRASGGSICWVSGCVRTGGWGRSLLGVKTEIVFVRYAGILKLPPPGERLGAGPWICLSLGKREDSLRNSGVILAQRSFHRFKVPKNKTRTKTLTTEVNARRWKSE